MKPNNRTTTQQRGFTMTQMVITLSIIAIVSTGGVLGIRTARAEFRLQNSARLFATYIEKARADAIRRHAATDQESSIETFGPGSTTYAITMDFGSGVVETRNFDLEAGLNFATAAKRVTFDWRGRITEAWVFQILVNIWIEVFQLTSPDQATSLSANNISPINLFRRLRSPRLPETSIRLQLRLRRTLPSATPPLEESGDPEATPTPTPNRANTDSHSKRKWQR